jgi:SNF2 family DNA or RNA helicase
VLLPDPRQLPPGVRRQAAERARRAHDAREFTARLRYFNSAPCRAHAALQPGCLDCGVELRRHQRTGAAWLWFQMRGLLADSCGLGKTAQLAAVLAMALETGELGTGNRAVVVCQAAAVRQWAAELRRMVPSLAVVALDGGPEDRMRALLGPWELAVISDRTLAPAGKPGKRGYRPGDVERLRQFPVGIVAYDDVDAMRNGATRTAWAVKRLAQGAERVYGLHATPLQKRLPELYCHLEPVGGREALGSMAQFKREYVAQSQVILWIAVARATPAERNAWARKKEFASYAALLARAEADRQRGVELEESPARRLAAAVQSGRARLQRGIWKDSGVRESALPEFRRRVAPLILRRTVADLDDVTLPAVQENQVWLDLLPEQRRRYDQLAQGILTRLRDTGTEVTRVEAAAAYTRARQVCSGLAALDDGRDVSAKLDWAVDRITGDLSGDKVIAFVYFRPNVAALSRRLEEAGVGHVLLWSEETDSAERARRIARFTNDPDCRVVVGTTTMERSLNLQAASHLIAVDTIANPARMEQVLGRARRMGSGHGMVVFHQLLARGTYEEDLLALLQGEQATANAVWGEQGALFSPDLTPRQVLQAIARRAA